MSRRKYKSNQIKRFTLAIIFPYCISYRINSDIEALHKFHMHASIFRKRTKNSAAVSPRCFSILSGINLKQFRVITGINANTID